MYFNRNIYFYSFFQNKKYKASIFVNKKINTFLILMIYFSFAIFILLFLFKLIKN